MTTPDAIVSGSGPNGLVGANLLADQGWEVLVLEAQPDPGGAVRSCELTEPGFVHDRFSAFYPLAAASPVIGTLGLEDFGLRWRHAPVALANPTPDGACAVLLGRSFRRTGMRLLFWSALCFFLLAANNLLVIVDLLVLQDRDFGLPRALLESTRPQAPRP